MTSIQMGSNASNPRTPSTSIAVSTRPTFLPYHLAINTMKFVIVNDRIMVLLKIFKNEMLNSLELKITYN